MDTNTTVHTSLAIKEFVGKSIFYGCQSVQVLPQEKGMAFTKWITFPFTVTKSTLRVTLPARATKQLYFETFQIHPDLANRNTENLGFCAHFLTMNRIDSITSKSLVVMYRGA